MTVYSRNRLKGLAVLVAVGGPLFLAAGLVWQHPVQVDEAVARFREAGPQARLSAPGLPEPGVYRYATSGGERISFLEHRREYSDVTARIVTRRGCGVREEQRFLVQHIEYYDRCGKRLVSYGTDIAYWWTHGTQDFLCREGSFDGSDLAVGGRSEWVCGDEDTEARQLVEYVADEVVTVDGTPRPARRTRWTTIFSGATEGSAVVDDWFDPDTGLVLREDRNIALRVGSPFVGPVTYVDISAYRLLSTVPLR